MSGGVVLARLESPMPRRVLAVAVLVMLASFLIFTIFTQPDLGTPWATVVLGGLGLCALACAVALWRATANPLVLTARGLEDGAGVMLCPVEEIERVESGLLAFRPSNGFVLRLKSRQKLTFAPGLWWRQGRRFGVGGAVAASQSKAMAQAIQSLLDSRAGPAVGDETGPI